MLTTGSLFGGVGGFPLTAVQNGITPVWASEIEVFPIEVTKHHVPGMIHVGDITRLDGAKPPPVDMICGGSPCQALSVAGARTGLNGIRSGLFMEQIHIVKEMRNADMERGRTGFAVRPRWMCWENVSGALSAQPGMKQQIFIAQECPPWDTQQARIFTSESKAPTLASADGGGGRNPGGLLFTAGFCTGASPAVGSIGYQEEISPTLKASASGNMMPSVLCLTDHGGQRMDLTTDMTPTLRAQMGARLSLICLNDLGGGVVECSEDVAGTLWAQEHGYEPLVFDNHGQDARFRGSVGAAQTISARFGAGGNNQPPVFGIQRDQEDIELPKTVERYENHGLCDSSDKP